jgi:shikimate 5-dehydrogenase
VNVSQKGAVGSLEEYSALGSGTVPLGENIAQAAAAMELLPKHAVVSDILLPGHDTPLISAAKAAGFVTMDGIPMVVNQGVEAFWLLHSAVLETLGITKAQVYDVMRNAAYQ